MVVSISLTQQSNCHQENLKCRTAYSPDDQRILCKVDQQQHQQQLKHNQVEQREKKSPSQRAQVKKHHSNQTKCLHSESDEECKMFYVNNVNLYHATFIHHCHLSVELDKCLVTSNNTKASSSCINRRQRGASSSSLRPNSQRKCFLYQLFLLILLQFLLLPCIFVSPVLCDSDNSHTNNHHHLASLSPHHHHHLHHHRKHHVNLPLSHRVHRRSSSESVNEIDLQSPSSSKDQLPASLSVNESSDEESHVFLSGISSSSTSPVASVSSDYDDQYESSTSHGVSRETIDETIGGDSEKDEIQVDEERNEQEDGGDEKVFHGEKKLETVESSMATTRAPVVGFSSSHEFAAAPTSNSGGGSGAESPERVEGKGPTIALLTPGSGDSFLTRGEPGDHIKVDREEEEEEKQLDTRTSLSSSSSKSDAYDNDDASIIHESNSVGNSTTTTATGQVNGESNNVVISLTTPTTTSVSTGGDVSSFPVTANNDNDSGSTSNSMLDKLSGDPASDNKNNGSDSPLSQQQLHHQQQQQQQQHWLKHPGGSIVPSLVNSHPHRHHTSSSSIDSSSNNNHHHHNSHQITTASISSSTIRVDVTTASPSDDSESNNNFNVNVNTSSNENNSQVTSSSRPSDSDSNLYTSSVDTVSTSNEKEDDEIEKNDQHLSNISSPSHDGQSVNPSSAIAGSLERGKEGFNSAPSVSSKVDELTKYHHHHHRHPTYTGQAESIDNLSSSSSSPPLLSQLDQSTIDNSSSLLSHSVPTTVNSIMDKINPSDTSVTSDMDNTNMSGNSDNSHVELNQFVDSSSNLSSTVSTTIDTSVNRMHQLSQFIQQSYSSDTLDDVCTSDDEMLRKAHETSSSSSFVTPSYEKKLSTWSHLLFTNYTFHFTRRHYNVCLPENSLGKTYATQIPDPGPRLQREDDDNDETATYDESTHTKSSNQQVKYSVEINGDDKMGIHLPLPEMTVKYRIVGGNEKKSFEVESRVIGNFAFLLIRTSSSLESGSILNREGQEYYHLKIRAFISWPKYLNSLRDTSNRSHNRVKSNLYKRKVRCDVTVKIIDANDLSPLFYPLTYDIDVFENVPVDTKILTLSAFDSDIGMNGEIYYSFSANESILDFAVHPTRGIISVTRPLNMPVLRSDGSEIPTLYHQRKRRLIVYARDREAGGNSIRSSLNANTGSVLAVQSRATVNIRILPAPSASESKNTLHKFTSTGDDDDDDNNSNKSRENENELTHDTHSLRGKNINQQHESLRKQFSSSTRQRLSHTKASSSSSFSSPSASKQSTGSGKEKRKDKVFRFSVAENCRLATIVGTIKVNDDLINDLTRTYDDSGDIFDQPAVQASSEIDDGKYNNDSPVTSTSLSTFTYKLLNHKNIFALDSRSGILTVKGKIDREETDQYKLHVTVIEAYTQSTRVAGTNTFTGHSSIIRNDAARDVHSSSSNILPEFSFSSTSTSSPGGKVIHDEIANKLTYTSSKSMKSEAAISDALTGQSTMFSSSSSNSDNSRHQVTSKSQQIFNETISPSIVNNKINEITHHVTVIVTITDVNDNCPVFREKTYYARAREDLPVGTIIMRMKAIDYDEGSGGRIKYSIRKESLHSPASASAAAAASSSVNIQQQQQVSSSSPLMIASQVFSIDQLTGSIRIARQLNYQIKQVYNLTIIASDEGIPSLSSTANLLIEIEDVDDNQYAPHFTDNILTGSVKENSPIGTHVMNVIASDADSTFTLSNSPTNLLSSSSSSVSSANSFNTMSEEDESPDNDGDIDDDTIQVNNENTAVADAAFADAFHSTSSSGQQRSGNFVKSAKSFIRTSKSNQKDNLIKNNKIIDEKKKKNNINNNNINSNNGITYHLVGGNGVGKFTLDQYTGAILTAQILDRELQSKYWLLIVAKDNSPIPKSTSVNVYIQVTDENDNAPVTVNFYYQSTIMENATVGTPIIQLSSTDADDQMSISEQIDVNIMTSGTASYKNILGDGKMFDSSSTEQFNEQLTSPDDANLADGKLLPSVSSTKKSSNQHFKSTGERVSYRIVSSHLYPFNIDAETGLISLKEKVDRETQSQYVIDVEVSEKSDSNDENIDDDFDRDDDLNELNDENTHDNIHSPGNDAKVHGHRRHRRQNSHHVLMSRTPVIINIADVNDNSPRVLSSRIRCQVFNNLPGHIPICHVIAWDSDTLTSNFKQSPCSLEYEITEGNEKLYFSIHPSTGALYLNTSNGSLISPRTYDLTVSGTFYVIILSSLSLACQMLSACL